jgi:tripartite-type tricarboxylate transporter receptor subunit TctC
MAAGLVQQINAAMSAAILAPPVAERLQTQGISPTPSPAEAFARELTEEVAEWARVAQTAGIRPR